MTEIEVYDTTQPPDSATGQRPVKARIRQRKAESGESLTVDKATESGQAEVKSESAADIRSDTRGKETETAAPTAWERFKNIFFIGAALLLVAALAGVIYRLFKLKK